MYSAKAPKYLKTGIVSIFALLISGQVIAKDWLVETPEAYKKVMGKSKEENEFDSKD